MTCPWSGNAISSDALTDYHGNIVGFCNTGCRDKFDAAANIFDDCVQQVGGGALKRNFMRYALYNEWINQKVFAATAKLSPEHMNKNTGAFFSSVIGTLNHILVWDITWLQRFAGHTTPYLSLKQVTKLHSPSRNDEIIHANLADLRVARTKIDQALIDFISETCERDFNANFSYKRVSGEKFCKNFGGMIQHVFNHQTHHRGQVTTLLFQMGIDPGVTDLLVTLEEEIS